MLINTGGNVLAIGQPSDRPWKVGIRDPRTGQTVDLVASVTIMASDGKDAGLRSDGNSKPLFITGPQHWREMAQCLSLNEMMLIDANRNVEITPAMQRRMVTEAASG